MLKTNDEFRSRQNGRFSLCPRWLVLSARRQLALALKIKEWWEKNGSVGGQNPATKNIDAFSHFLENASQTEVDTLPADLQKFLRQYLENERLYDQMLQEVLVMQITLQERYKPVMFPLPPIAAE